MSKAQTTAPAVSGLTCDIYRSDYNSHINKFKDKKTVLLPMQTGGPFTPDEDCPLIKIVKRNLFGVEYIHAEPAEQTGGESYAFGGSFIYTSDSRFRTLYPYPIPLHDYDMSKEARSYHD